MGNAVPITATSKHEALRRIRRAAPVADFIELRLDYLQLYHMESSDLEELLRCSNVPKIATFRHKDEGGSDNFKCSEEERSAYLQMASDLGADYVDIEADHFHPIDRKSTKLIISHHNFNETPENLREIYQKICRMNPDIAKIATMAQTYDDSLRMLRFIRSIRSSDVPLIGICMGEKGVITRILGPSCGSYLTFGSLEEGKESAPGQLSVYQLKRWNEILELYSSR